MKTAIVFPGQGSQKPGMGKELYEGSAAAKAMFDSANEVLGFDIVDIMFNGTAEDLTKTSVTQPAVYIHSVALAKALGKECDMVAGHSLGELSALAAAEVLSFEDGLRLVAIRANAMQKACDAEPSTMAAIIGLDFDTVEKICQDIPEIVVPANYNSPGQLVISGSKEGIAKAIDACKEAGAKIAKEIPVNGAFHSPLMQPAAEELEAGIRATTFNTPKVPVYQNVSAQAETDPAAIQANLIAQLTSPVRWTQSVEAMIADGADTYVELGPGRVLQGLIKRINRKMNISGQESI